MHILAGNDSVKVKEGLSKVVDDGALRGISGHLGVASKLVRLWLWRKLPLFPTKSLLVLLSDSLSKPVWQGLFCCVSPTPFWCFIYWSVHLRQTAYVVFLAKQRSEWMRKPPKKNLSSWFPTWSWLESCCSLDRASIVLVNRLACCGNASSCCFHFFEIKTANKCIQTVCSSSFIFPAVFLELD